MNFGLFFGVVLIIWGLSHILNTIFHIHIPFAGILFGLFLVYIGIRVMFNSSFYPSLYSSHDTKHVHATCMGTMYVTCNDATLQRDEVKSRYTTLFGTTIIDMTQLTAKAITQKEHPLILHIDTTFGKTIVKLNKDIPLKIEAHGGFAKIVMPDNNSIAFGSHTFTSGDTKPLIVIYTTTVFGETRITT